MKRQRKRAPGAGRPPSGKGITPPLTMRLPTDLREVLEAKAQKKDRDRRKRNQPRWSLSDEIRRRLEVSLHEEFENQHDPATRAVVFLIAETARRVHFGGMQEWHFNPFLFEALKLAVAGVLGGITPQGKITPPSISKFAGKFYPAVPDPVINMLTDRWETPEKAGTGAAKSVLQELYFPDPLRKVEHFEDEIYGFERARHDLGIDKRIEERKEPKS